MGRERVLAMDLLRGLAVVAMIGVHTVNALLDPALRQGVLFAVVHFASGLVAPAFLLVAGFTFLLGNAAEGAVRPRLPRVLGRIGLIWLVGYLLHLPAYTLGDWRARVGALQWQEFLGVDVLHCIGAGLLVLLVLRLVVPGGRALLGAVVLAGSLAVLLARPVWQADLATRLPLWLSGYLAPFGTTLFPLLPWFGFVAAGAALSLLWTRTRAAGEEERFQRALLRTGLALALPGLALLVLVRDHLHLLVDERPAHFFSSAGWASCSCSLPPACAPAAAGPRCPRSSPGRRARHSSSMSCTSSCSTTPCPGGDPWSNCSARTWAIPAVWPWPGRSSW